MQPDLFESQLTLTEADLADRTWLEDWLRARNEWATAHAIQESSPAHLGDRATRALASSSRWIISGQRGYKHLECATAEEVQHAASWLESQAKKMSDRACAIRRNAHRIIH